MKNEGVTAPPLGVRPPTRSMSTASEPAPSPVSESAAASDPLDAGPSNTDTLSGSEPGEPLRLKKRPLAEVLRGLVLSGSEAAHQALARTEAEQEMGLWLMQSEEEAAGIADPLANIAQRHAGGSLVNPDMNDMIAAGIAFAGYLIGNAVAAFRVRRAMRRMRSAILADSPTEQGDES